MNDTTIRYPDDTTLYTTALISHDTARTPHVTTLNDYPFHTSDLLWSQLIYDDHSFASMLTICNSACRSTERKPKKIHDVRT